MWSVGSWPVVGEVATQMLQQHSSDMRKVGFEVRMRDRGTDGLPTVEQGNDGEVGGDEGADHEDADVAQHVETHRDFLCTPQTCSASALRLGLAIGPDYPLQGLDTE